MSRADAARVPAVAEAAMNQRRLRAPQSQGGLLLEPSLSEAPALIAANRQAREQCDYDVQGRSLTELATSARRELLAEAYRYTSDYRDVARPAADGAVLLAGHQPEMFHPGVWFKNFALARLANTQQAAAINLLIDSDTIKGCTLRVPGGPPDAPLAESMAFDDPSEEIPYEERAIRNRELFASFGARASQRLAPFVPQPLLEDYWPLVQSRAAEHSNLGQCLASARHQLEGQWGLQTLEFPQSRVCQLEAFWWFTAHLLAHLPRLVEVHNATLAEYRAAHHIRSANHPVPELSTDDGWLEAPFWVWTAQEPRRRRLFARQIGDQIELTDRRQLRLQVPLTADGDASAAVNLLSELPRQGVRLRTRALTTTLLARLLLGDLFLHGIGGAKYDELTDQLIARFFGLPPPGFLVASATLRLQPVTPGAARSAARQLAQRLREMKYQPERFLPETTNGQSPEAAQLVAEKQRWLAASGEEIDAHERHVAIGRCNIALQSWLEPLRAEWSARLQELRRRQNAEAVLGSREYAFCLYPKDDLRNFLLAFVEGSL